MNHARQLHILPIERIIGKRERQIVLETASQTRRHSAGSEAISFESGLIFVRCGGIKMEADEQISLALFGDSYTVREREVAIVRAGQINLPAFGREKGCQPAGPIERELLLVPISENALCARIFAAMSGIDDDNSICPRRPNRVSAQQRLNRFLEVER